MTSWNSMWLKLEEQVTYDMYFFFNNKKQNKIRFSYFWNISIFIYIFQKCVNLYTNTL